MECKPPATLLHLFSNPHSEKIALRRTYTNAESYSSAIRFALASHNLLAKLSSRASDLCQSIGLTAPYSIICYYLYLFVLLTITSSGQHTQYKNHLRFFDITVCMVPSGLEG